MDALEARATSVDNRVARIETQLAANGDARREREALSARVDALESLSQSG